jgi:hypothetical protein
MKEEVTFVVTICKVVWNMHAVFDCHEVMKRTSQQYYSKGVKILNAFKEARLLTVLRMEGNT